MRIKNVSLLLALVATASISLSALAQYVPSTTQTHTSAGGKASRSGVTLQDFGTPVPVLIRVTPVNMVSPWSPTSANAQNAVIADWQQSKFPSGDGLLPTGYWAVQNGKVSWYHFATASTVPLHDGIQNPTGAWAGQFGPQNAVVITAETVDGLDGISLADLTYLSSSSDSGNILGDTLGFVGNTYTEQAILIKANGAVITSGSTAEKGAKLIVIVYPKSFNGGDTAKGLEDIRDFVTTRGNFAQTFRVTAFGLESTASYATASLLGYTDGATSVAIDRQNVWVKNPGAGRTYILETKDSVTGTGKFLPFAVITGGQRVPYTPNQPADFFRLQIQ